LHSGGGVHCRRGGVWYGGHSERCAGTTGGHHRVHSRAPAHHLLHHRLFFPVQSAWKKTKTRLDTTFYNAVLGLYELIRVRWTIILM